MLSCGTDLSTNLNYIDGFATAAYIKSEFGKRRYIHGRG